MIYVTSNHTMNTAIILLTYIKHTISLLHVHEIDRGQGMYYCISNILKLSQCCTGQIQYHTWTHCICVLDTSFKTHTNFKLHASILNSEGMSNVQSTSHLSVPCLLWAQICLSVSCHLWAPCYQGVSHIRGCHWVVSSNSFLSIIFKSMSGIRLSMGMRRGEDLHWSALLCDSL